MVISLHLKVIQIRNSTLSHFWKVLASESALFGWNSYGFWKMHITPFIIGLVGNNPNVIGYYWCQTVDCIFYELWKISCTFFIPVSVKFSSQCWTSGKTKAIEESTSHWEKPTPKVEIVGHSTFYSFFWQQAMGPVTASSKQSHLERFGIFRSLVGNVLESFGVFVNIKSHVKSWFLRISEPN